jgi:hypothetical protein
MRLQIVSICLMPPTFRKILVLMNKLGSSVSIVYGYGLEDQTIDVRSPAEAKHFTSNL